ncbi:putative arginine decarboxylase [Capsicum annuum]|nr:putative arginine decarboxylase [Capsicum annuum]
MMQCSLFFSVAPTKKRKNGVYANGLCSVESLNGLAETVELGVLKDRNHGDHFLLLGKKPKKRGGKWPLWFTFQIHYFASRLNGCKETALFQDPQVHILSPRTPCRSATGAEFCLQKHTTFFDGYGCHGRSFEQTYRCYPASFIDKPQIENGDKIIIPPSALDRLASLHIDYPMLFELRNTSTERVSHCGVLEFIAEEGMIYMPYWMMENLFLQEGDIVTVKNVTLPKGKYVKLQPHTKDFLDISNPKAILEMTLRNFSCLTTGDSIMVSYNNKKYYIDIVEGWPWLSGKLAYRCLPWCARVGGSKRPSSEAGVRAHCEVDFAPPLDYKEPERDAPSRPSKAPAEVQEVATEVEPKFNPFTGGARRLDGKSLKQQPPPSSSSVSSDKQADVTNGGKKFGAAPSSQTSSRQSQGKLVFGSNANRAPGKQKEPMKEEAQKKEEPKFQPFSGKKYSLRG